MLDPSALLLVSIELLEGSISRISWSMVVRKVGRSALVLWVVPDSRV